MTVCTPWRVAASENVLLEQIDHLWPNRSKRSDGSIGDTAHQVEQCSSQHNSCCIRLNGVWIIRARDFTHDPASGADMRKIWLAIIASRDDRVRYMIFNRQIVYPTPRNGYGAWVPQPYHGDDPHTGHLHLSVLDDPAKFDNTRAWAVGGPTPPGVKPAIVKRGSMFTVQAEGDAAVFLTNGAGATHIGPDLFADLNAGGIPYVLVNDQATLNQVCHFGDQGPEFTPDQIGSITKSLVDAVTEHPDTPLGDADKPAITAAVLDAFAALLKQAGAAA